MVKEIAMYDGKIDSFVHPIVGNYLAKKQSVDPRTLKTLEAFKH